MSEMERRFVIQEDAEVRMEGEDGKKTVRGYAAMFNSLSEDLGGFRERILPTAFDAALKKNPDVRALFNHDSNFLLGRTTSGTLRLWADERGLGYAVSPPDSRSDVMESIARKDITGSSFAFRLAKDGDAWLEENGKIVREIRSFDMLLDVGPVTYPAYRDTKVAVRSLEEFRKEHEEEKPEDKPSDPQKPSGPSNEDRLRKLRLMERS